MRRESFGFLKVIPIWVALMSGAFSIVREAASLFAPTQSPLWDKKLFWACVWAAFVVSSLTAWFLEHAEVLKMRKRLDDPERRKKIREELGKFLDERDNFSCFPGVSLSQDDRKSLKQLDLKIIAYLAQNRDASYVARFKAEPLSALKDFIRELLD